jgi:hypothetical protein
VKEITVEERKKLFDWSQLLSPNDRKRIYIIKIAFKSLELTESEFGITYDEIQYKITWMFLPMLLDFIGKVEKKSYLKT